MPQYICQLQHLQIKQSGVTVFLAKLQHRIIIASIFWEVPFLYLVFVCLDLFSLSVFQAIDCIQACQFINKFCQLFSLALEMGCFPAKLIQLECHLHTNQCSYSERSGRKEERTTFFFLTRKEYGRFLSTKASLEQVTSALCMKMPTACFSEWGNTAGTSSVLELSIQSHLQYWTVTSQYIPGTVSPCRGGKCARGVVRDALNFWRSLGS